MKISIVECLLTQPETTGVSTKQFIQLHCSPFVPILCVTNSVTL